VRAGAVSEGAWYEPGDVAFIGEPAHGVVLWGGDATTRSIVLAPLTRTLPRAVRSHFVQQAPLVVPGADVPELVGEYLPRLAHVVGVGSRDGSVPLPGPTRVRLRGQVTWHEDASAVLAWRWVHSSDEGPERDLPVDDPTVGRLLRDPAREQQVVGLLEADETVAALLGVGQHGPGTLAAELRFRGLDALGFATDVLPRLEDVARRSDGSVELVLVGRTPDFRPATGVPEVRFTSSEGDHREGRTDWLELEVVVAIRDEELGTVQIGLAQVLAALASGSTTVMVRDHVYVDLDRPELDRLARLVADARAMVDQPPRGIRLSRDHHDLLADLAGLVEAGPSDGRVREWTRAAAALRELPATEPPAEPAGLQATLRPYQRAGYAWMSFLHEHGLGGVLADDMGLGKTVQTLAMVARARESDPQAPPFLVVAPASVVSTWVAEAARFTPGLRVVAITESAARRGWGLDRLAERSPDVVVTTYTLLRLEAAGYAGLRWAGLVLDEAQSVKNHTSKTYDAARRVEAGSRFAITGTPMENNLMELWSILSLTAPGLFPHAADFRERFAKPIEQDASPDALAVLRRRIGPVVLRRTKDLVASDLPAKQEQVLTVELGPRHRKLYDTHLQRERQRVLKLLEDLDENRISILASLTRLRQLSLDPALVDPEHEKVGSAKIDLLVEHLSEIAAEGHRALVFSQFTSFLSRVARRLTAAGLGYSYLDGSTRRRGEVVDGFRSGTDPVFLISLKAGGVGLTLTEADYCFLLDPWWNPAVEAQAVDRAHRIGQTRNVVVYRLVSAGTVEEKVMELARRKAALFASVVGADSLASTSLTADDIAALLEP
ncbi:DEAD/DEAH box helicase, partial [Auraticoccus cholistanensis]|uniref:DEAD/DEAH box helicase n=1 Tax=Auraticoccus cholistanensis TaxID=2656650 RepID=UPI0018D2212B